MWQLGSFLACNSFVCRMKCKKRSILQERNIIFPFCYTSLHPFFRFTNFSAFGKQKQKKKVGKVLKSWHFNYFLCTQSNCAWEQVHSYCQLSLSALFGNHFFFPIWNLWSFRKSSTPIHIHLSRLKWWSLLDHWLQSIEYIGSIILSGLLSPPE